MCKQTIPSDGGLDRIGDWMDGMGDWMDGMGDWMDGMGDWMEGLGDWMESAERMMVARMQLCAQVMSAWGPSSREPTAGASGAHPYAPTLE